MAEPKEVIEKDEDYIFCQFEAFGSGQQLGQLAARKDEDRVSQFDNGEMAQVAHVDAMAKHADEGEEKREAVNQSQEGLDGDDGINEARKKLAGKHGVLLYQFGEVIKSACYMKERSALM